MTADRRDEIRASSRGTLRWIGLGVFCLSASVILLEIAISRILSVTLWYHFSFLAISMAILGLGLGSALAYRLRSVQRHLVQSMVGFVVLTPLVVKWAMGLTPPNLSEMSRASVLPITFKLTLLALPFLFAGTCLATVFRSFRTRIGWLYGWDLGGAAVAAFCVVPLLDRISTPSVVLVAACLGSAGAIAFGRLQGDDAQSNQRRKSLLIAMVLLPAFAVALLAANLLTGWFEVRHSKGNSQKPTIERWNSLARLAVFPVRPPTGEKGEKIAYRLVLDGCAATVMHPFTDDPEQVRKLRSRGSALAFLLRPSGSFAIIGPGGGEDVLTALTYPETTIDAMEINPAVIEVVNHDLGHISGHLYEHDRVRVIIGDGRYTIQKSHGTYDVVHLSMIDTFAASTAGAMALSENNLYTVEAFEEYLHHLKDRGLLSVTWWKFPKPRISARIVLLARAALEQMDIPTPMDHIVVFEHDSKTRRRMTLLVQKGPFTPAEMERIQGQARQHDWTLLHPVAADLPTDVLSKLAVTESAQMGVLERSMNSALSVPTDDRPFLFHTHRLTDYLTGPFKPVDSQVFGWMPVFLLSTLFCITVVSCSVAIVWPWVLRPEWWNGPERIRFAVYFSGLGMGFLAIESVLIQMFVLLLGHPSYALTCIIFSLLLSAGLGSTWAGSRWEADPMQPIRKALIGTGMYVILLLAIKPWLYALLSGTGLGLRLVVTVAILAPLGFLMGMPFQAGLRRLGQRTEQAIPWAWAINATTSVLGSVVAVLVTLHFGFTAAAWFGAAMYFMAAGFIPGVGSAVA